MSGTPVEIHWFPRHTDRFFTWGSEINLYEVKSSDTVDHRILSSAFNTAIAANLHRTVLIRTISISDINLDISPGTTATLLASETKYQYIRCVAPSYRNAPDLLLAVGLANGKVGLCNFVPSAENSLDYSEFNNINQNV